MTIAFRWTAMGSEAVFFTGGFAVVEAVVCAPSGRAEASRKAAARVVFIVFKGWPIVANTAAKTNVCHLARGHLYKYEYGRADSEVATPILALLARRFAGRREFLCGPFFLVPARYRISHVRSAGSNCRRPFVGAHRGYTRYGAGPDAGGSSVFETRAPCRHPDPARCS